MTGFFIFESRYGDRIGFRCSCCHLFTVFPQGKTPKVWHCNRWSEYHQPVGFWQKSFAEELPRVKPQSPVILRRSQETDELHYDGQNNPS
jgi:hypothetical protein